MQAPKIQPHKDVGIRREEAIHTNTDASTKDTASQEPFAIWSIHPWQAADRRSLAPITASSAICGLAPSLGILIASRTVQGVGGALLMAVSPAMLTNAFPAHERGRALGINAINVALGVSVGPIWGGIITASFSWRWIFYVNIPIGIIGLIATLLILKERIHLKAGRFDPLGALLIAGGALRRQLSNAVLS